MKILNASKRTDLPAFYAKELCYRMRRNLDDFFILWTKDIRPLMDTGILAIHKNWYIQHTLTSYNRDIEPNMRDKLDIITDIKLISEKYGKNRVVLRYDPIFISDKYNMDYHRKYFKKLCEYVHEHVDTITFSYLDWYRNIPTSLPIPSLTTQRNIAEMLAEIVQNYNIKLNTCAEGINLSKLGIEHAQCVDPKRIEQISGIQLDSHISAFQRRNCGCIQAFDIGSYKQECKHKCLYCYANHN